MKCNEGGGTEVRRRGSNTTTAVAQSGKNKRWIGNGGQWCFDACAYKEGCEGA
jgi:hypothetical protein